MIVRNKIKSIRLKIVLLSIRNNKIIKKINKTIMKKTMKKILKKVFKREEKNFIKKIMKKNKNGLTSKNNKL